MQAHAASSEEVRSTIASLTAQVQQLQSVVVALTVKTQPEVVSTLTSCMSATLTDVICACGLVNVDHQGNHSQ